MKSTLLASALGFAALASAQAAQAQNACIMPEDAADTVMYLMPIAYDGMLKTCKNEFSDDSFLPSADGRNYIEKFRTISDETWPGTYRAVEVLMASQGGEDDGMAETLGQLDSDQLRPFADAFVGQIIAQEIKPDSCGKIDRGVELLSPLPAENVGGLVSFVLELVGGGNDLPICNADGTVRVIPEGSLPAGEQAYDPAAEEAGE
ncbi:MAG: hypothetical protein HRT64_11470 [Erythrobacter sp.]|nr:hypothetical protein [Erythrobacter sp.]